MTDAVPTVQDEVTTNRYIPYKWWSEYSSPKASDSQKVADNWQKIIPDHGIVAVPHDYAEQYGIPPSVNAPGDPSKALYLLEAYHQIHCIVSAAVLLSSSTGCRCLRVPP